MFSWNSGFSLFAFVDVDVRDEKRIGDISSGGFSFLLTAKLSILDADQPTFTVIGVVKRSVNCRVNKMLLLEQESFLKSV